MRDQFPSIQKQHKFHWNSLYLLVSKFFWFLKHSHDQAIFKFLVLYMFSKKKLYVQMLWQFSWLLLNLILQFLLGLKYPLLQRRLRKHLIQLGQLFHISYQLQTLCLLPYKNEYPCYLCLLIVLQLLLLFCLYFTPFI